MPLASGTRLGPYDVVAPLGAGGMGEVYRARDTRLNRDVAVKLLGGQYSSDPTRLMRFEQEARAVSSLNHPHIVTIFDVGQSAGGSYIVMELVEGRTLRELLEGGALPLKKAINIAAQVADGLAKAHSAGIVHRDLKPENIMVSADGFAKILDFGLAKLIPLASGATVTVTAAGLATSAGMILGTVGYMSPEQARGKEIDFRSDQFSFGAMFYEMLTGKRPFQRDSAAQTLAAIIQDEAEAVTGLNAKVPLPVRWIVERCLAKDPEERYAATRDLARDLQSVRDHLSEASSHISQLGIAPAQRSWTRHWPVAAAVVLAVVAGLLLGRAFFRSAPMEPPRMRFITFSGVDADPAVAPDGRSVAFVSERDGKARIWLKQLAGGGEAPITEGPDGWPRFSPDGSTLVFARFAPDKPPSIYRSSVVGGEARKLADNGRSPDWSPDGKQVVFLRDVASRPPSLEIVVAEADGSNARVVTSTKAILRGVRWSPDGKQLIAVDQSIGLTSARTTFFVFSLDGKEMRTVQPAIAGGALSMPVWTGNPDEILYARAESVGTVGPASGGPMVLMLQNLRTGAQRRLLSIPANVIMLDILADGRLVSDFSSTRQNLREVPLGSAKGERRWLTRGNAGDRQPTFAGASEWVAFTSNRSGNLDLWAVSTATGVVRRLTDHPAEDWDPAFSPDGKYLLWSSARSGNFEIWMAEADGSGARQVSHDGVDAENPAMTPDGWVVYNSGNPAARGLFKVRPDGTEATRLTQQSCNWPDITREGTHVACNFSLEGNVVVRVADGSIVAHGPAGRPRWSPDGRVVAWTGYDPATQARGIMGADFVPGTLPAARVIVPREEFTVETFAFSPDGKRVVYSTLEYTDSLVIIDNVPAVKAPKRLR
jgi:eukaryotic-like serine/threonine-protein kinase